MPASAPESNPIIIADVASLAFQKAENPNLGANTWDGND
jgi:hypothetical protein